ncbi:succinate dehydrogenase cytochrome b subunit [Aeromicrobium sp.]|uniref:succinate dehydrogenase cytochrome b subunit n=1 Tax=Aeromicrobium sp. TaxID=1871063 RepID=UPI0019AA0297|nr:succinate dehydrogenase cytochrome b subunit [Aeromicrobium sp.]MBC7630200.1 succinate dehydrogenase cytochrome b subunit [Aeromicrobium sp.]
MATTQLSKRTSARSSTVVLKYAMAVSGLIMVGYLVLHMYGNLKAFAGPSAFNEYAHHLRTIGTPILPEKGLLWIVRVVLLAAVLLHAYAAATLWRRNKKAAGYVGAKRYQTKQGKSGVQRSYASFTMRWGGVTIALFIVFHILNLTTNTIHPGGAADTAYGKLHNSFEHWWVLLAYTVAMIAVGFHLWHGFWSAFTTLGQNRSSTRVASRWNTAAIGIAAIITIGFLAPPFSIYFFGLGG